MGKVYKEFLKIYLIRCEKTRELVKQENEQTRNLVKELITTVKDTSSQTTISQLETSIMIVNKLDSCQCDSMKRVKETLSQMNRSEFREDTTCAKTSIEKTWIEKFKSRKDFFWRHHRNKRLEELYNSGLLKENPCIPRKFLSNYNGKETKKKGIMQNLTKEKVRVELQLQNIRYERQSECKKQIDNEMENLTKPSNFSEKIALILQEQ